MYQPADIISAYNALERIAITLDEGRIEEFDADLESEDPLQFPGYAGKLEAQRKALDYVML